MCFLGCFIEIASSTLMLSCRFATKFDIQLFKEGCFRKDFESLKQVTNGGMT